MSAIDSRLSEDGIGVWRDGPNVVIAPQARLPARCVKTNAPVDVVLEHKLTWLSPWWCLTILFSPVVYLIVAMAVRRDAIVYVGLSRAALRRRRVAIAIAWLVPLLAFWPMYALGQAGSVVGMALAATFGIGGLISGYMASAPVRAKRIESGFAVVAGADPQFVAMLPPWPGKRPTNDTAKTLSTVFE
ncbi:hypothetical protein L6V77_29610 [Myxococcota bacterium]|nr:hypothetical protein [Myxococcota bacterium]